MASTYPPSTALDFAKRQIKSMNLETIAPQILDQANKVMWMAAPWRWTLGNLPAFQLISATQDYSIAVPTDFLYVFDVYVTDGAKAARELSVEPVLQADVGLVGQPSEVAYMGADTMLPLTNGIFRVAPKPSTQPASAPYVYQRYKKIAPVVSASSMYTAGILVFPDEWFWVYQLLVTWQAFVYSDDQRAGSAQVDGNGKAAYTGQLGAAMAALNFMREREKLPTKVPILELKAGNS